MDETNVIFARNELFTMVHAAPRDAGIQQVVKRSEKNTMVQPRKLYSQIK